MRFCLTFSLYCFEIETKLVFLKCLIPESKYDLSERVSFRYQLQI